MAGMPGVQEPARTNAEGRFVTTFPPGGMGVVKLHFASADFTLQAIRVIKAEDADKPIEVMLSPTRLVHARVIEIPNDDPKAYMNCSAYTVDASGKVVAEWLQWMLPNPNANDPDHVKRHLDVRLPVGRYKIEFRSQTLRRMVDVEVSPGDGPLELADLTVESLASVRMVGRQAAEIESVDLEGKPAKLADYRGKVVVLDFWATWCGPCVGAMPRLIEIHKRFHDRPVVFLALHDGSLVSAEAYRKAAEPLKARWGGGDLPFRGTARPAAACAGDKARFAGPGEKGSGRTAERYEVSSWPSTFWDCARRPARRQVHLGDFEVERGRKLAGRVVFTDGKAIPARTTVLASSENTPGLIRATVDPQGPFELLGLPESEVHVSVRFADIQTLLPSGYRLSPRNKCVDPLNPYRLVGKLDHDVDDLTILFEPGDKPEANYEPGVLEDFKEVKSGTIAGAPSESWPPKNELDSRPDQAAQEQDGAGAGVADQEEEGVVGPEDHGRLSDHRRSGNHDPRGCRGLRSFLVDLDERLVHDGRDRQLARARDSREIGRPRLERHGHPQLRERILQLASPRSA